MQLVTFSRKVFVALTAVGAIIMLPVAVSAAGVNLNPQTAPSKKAAAAAEAPPVPDQCILQTLLNSTEQKYRLTNNAPNTYTATGTAYFNVKCGLVTFTVPRGQDSLVDLSASAELNCDSPNSVVSSSPANGWCEGRFLVNSVNVLPNNTGRGDTFAWDSSNAGQFSWQANSLDQVGRATCPVSTSTKAPCTFHAQLQARLDNGATSMWVDDVTVHIDVSEGTVTSTNVTP